MGFVASIVGERRSRGYDASDLNNPAAWLVRLFGGGPTASGIDINEHTAMNLSAVWACVQVIAEDVAKLPFEVYRRRERGKDRAVDHPAYTLLHDQANPETTAFSFRSTLTAHALTWGNAYAEIEWKGNGQPHALWQLRPDRVTPRRDRESGSIVYDVQPVGGGQTRTLKAEDVIHIPGLSFDGLVGYSVISRARESLGLTAAAERFGAAFFGNGSVPSGIIKHAAQLGPEKKKQLKEGWEEAHRGTGNAQRVAVIDGGLEYQSIGLPAKDSQFLETRAFQVPEICRWFRVSPVKIGDLSRSTFSNIEHLAIAHVVDTLMPWLVRWEQEVKRKIFGLRDRTHFAEHNAAALLRGDLKSRYEAYAIARQWGWKSANDIRELENENPIDGGDTYLQPVNMAPSDSPMASGDRPEPPDPPVPPSPDPDSETDDEDDAERALIQLAGSVLEDTFARLAKIEADRISKAARSEGFDAWLSTFLDGHRDHVAAAVSATIAGLVRGAATIRGVESPSFGPLIDGLVTRHLERIRSFGAAWSAELSAAGAAVEILAMPELIDRLFPETTP